MAPKPPTLGPAPAKPWRASMTRELVLPKRRAKPPTLGPAPAKPWRASMTRELVLPKRRAKPPTLGAPRRSRRAPRRRARSGCRDRAREFSFASRGEGAHLTVRAIPARGVRRARLEVAGPDAGRRRLDRLRRLG